MSGSSNMTITIHAQERMEERWGITDQDVARLRELGSKGELEDQSDLYRYSLIRNLSDEEIKKFQLVVGLSDEEIGRVIQGEVNDAMIAGRHGTYCPLELANNSVERWGAKNGAWYCWLEDKSRGYACRDDEGDGLVVLTTLVGDDKETSRNKLRQRPGRR